MTMGNNTQKYWDKRFVEDWETKHGREQTAFFAELALNNTPDWFLEYILQNCLSVCDFGCALGDGVKLLRKKLTQNTIVGIDFSESGISRARQLYPELSLESRDLLNNPKYFDVVFSSNVLEHFKDPYTQLSKLTNSAGKFIWLLLPFYDDLSIDEHFFSFQFDNLPQVIENKFHLIFYKVIDCSKMQNAYWNSLQVLLIYATEDELRQLETKTQFVNELKQLLQQDAASLMSTLLQQHLATKIQANEIKLNVLQHMLNSKVAELNTIYSSRCWRMMVFYYQTKELICRWVKTFFRLLFSLVARISQKICNYWMKFFRIIREEGFKGIVKRIKTKLKRFCSAQKKIIEFELFKKQELFGQQPTNKYDLIFFSIINWDFRLQRPQHIATKFAQNGYRVFYLSVDLYKQKKFSVRKIAENIFEITLPYINNTNIYSLDVSSNIDLLTGALEELYHDFKIKESVAFVEYPLWYQAVNYLQNKLGAKVVFDCLDEFSGFAGAESNVATVETQLLTIADYCITTASRLFEKHSAMCKNIALVKNATEFEFFHKKPEKLLLTNLAKPIIGYYGAIAEWFDVDLIEYLAVSKPEWSIVLIGRTFGSDVEKLAKYKNVHTLGEKLYSELPQYLHNFDVCMIPFKLSELILATNPVKFYEYLSAGKPVVATKLPELLPYKDYVYLATNKIEFLEKVTKALQEDSTELREQRIKLAQANDWMARYQEINGLIKSVFPLVSIIIVTYNNLNYTKLCVQSIFAKTAYPNFELVMVDNASEIDTVTYLKELDNQYDNVQIILNDRNTGFAAANNTGINASKGEYIILLNNDTIVTRGWIDGLVKHLQDPNIGMVGPVTNSIGNEAKIVVAYKKIDDMDSFAEFYSAKHKAGVFDINMLAMYCVALRRETVNKVGLLDEMFNIGMFEDDDYSLRVKKAGMRVVCVEDVFIHHFGGASFGKLEQKKYQAIFENNKKLFEEKWGSRWVSHSNRD